MKYLLAYSIPIVAFFGIYYQGIWAYSAWAYAFVLLPILETLMPLDENNYSETELRNKLANHFYDIILYLNVPIVYGMLWYGLTKVTTTELSLFEIIGTILSLGIVLGSNGINVGHELGHREKLSERILGKLLLLPSFYTHFFIEHNHGHHLHVATPEDPSTARYNQNLYVFWIQTVTGTYTKAWKIQKKLNEVNNVAVFSLKNDMLWFTLIQISYAISIYLLFGKVGLMVD